MSVGEWPGWSEKWHFSTSKDSRVFVFFNSTTSRFSPAISLS
jgi:hypothetical protein